MTAAATAAFPDILPEQRFLFDLHGFVMLRGVLSPSECAEFLGVVAAIDAGPIDESWRGRLEPGHAQAARRTREADGPQVRLNGLLRLDPRFDRLMDHPRVLPFLRGFMHGPQLINTWSIAKDRDTAIGSWHRGATPMQYWCREGVIRTTMLNVVWFLTDNGPDDGCMAAVPGSHKSDIASLGSYEAVNAREGGADFDYASYSGLDLPGSVPLTGCAGDVLIFSEALIHNGLRKTTSGTRTNLYFNHIDRLHAVAGYESHNMRHFWLPERMRERFTPDRRELTGWMRHARYELDE